MSSGGESICVVHVKTGFPELTHLGFNSPSLTLACWVTLSLIESKHKAPLLIN